MEFPDYFFRVHTKYYYQDGTINKVLVGPFDYTQMIKYIKDTTDDHNMKDLRVECNDSKFTYLGSYYLNENGSQLKLSLADNPIIPVGLFKFLTIETPFIKMKLQFIELSRYRYEIIGLDNIYSGLEYHQMFNTLDYIINKNNFSNVRVNIYNPKTISNNLKGYIGRYRFNNDGSKLIPDLIDSAIFQLSILNTVLDTKQIYDKLQNQKNNEKCKYIIIHDNRVVKGSFDDMREFLKSIPLSEVNQVTICDIDDNTVYKMTDILSSFKTNDGKKLIY